ncbi:MAG TPA: zinc-ribbon domain-containing protein [Acetobacterium sp.]
MICPRCGKSNPEGTEFCLYCGANLQEKGSVKEEPEYEIKSMSDSQKNVPAIKKENSRKNLFIIIIGCIVLISIILVFLLR